MTTSQEVIQLKRELRKANNEKRDFEILFLVAVTALSSFAIFAY
ncbi:MAG: hypothetical protein WC725_05135 [Patescibacteria group bacterium]|jgi:hypothetical protein